MSSAEETLTTQGSEVKYQENGAEEVLQPRRLLSVPTRRNPALSELLDRIHADTRLHQLWRCANINAVDRSGMSDHGPVHIRIVSNIALKLARLLHSAGLTFDVVKNYGLTYEDAEVIILLGVALHDIGMSVHRHEHELYSFVLGAPIARQLLDGLYEEPQLTMVVSETLHAVVSHRSDETTYTLEAGVVKVADALDMTQGRSRIPFEQGAVNIHSLSAAAIERVKIGPGRRRPICVEVLMNNSAGLYQLDELLKPKINSSSLAPHVEVEARIESETEKRLLPVYNL
ncbi:MAG TPA: HD domain-containing protein [Chloroflexota bacterium]|nr:HD domain-containing protein [Chloroflexota bacterium]